MLLALTNIRQIIITAIPLSIKIATSAGIGLFLAAIALKNLNIITLSHHISLASHIVFNTQLFLCLLGLLIISFLDYHKINGAILFGILATTIIGLLLNIMPFKGFFSLPPNMHTTFLALNLPEFTIKNNIIAIFTFLVVALFENTGTLIGVLHQGKLIPPDGEVKRLLQVFLADSIATIFGALMGTSSVCSYIESAAGVRAGGRTGVTAIVVGLLFLMCLLIQPLAASIPSYATAAALLYVAVLMLRPIKYVEWKYFNEYIPALITLIAIPFTFSIADGIGLGLLSYIFLNSVILKFHNLNIALILTTAIFAVYLFLPS